MGILVTGASRGIGRAIARAFAEKGDRVAVHYATNREDAEQTLDGLPGSGHGLVQGDLSAPEVAQRVADEAEALVGGVDVLVNNAAYAPSAAAAHPVAEVSYADWQRIWRRMVEVNVLGTANVTFCVTRHMIGRDAVGRVVNIGSRGAFKGEPDFPAYGASKAALHSLGQSLAVALAPHGIAVTSVAPGFTATDRVAAKIDGASGESPFGRVGTPEEVAAAVLYLASADATWASGAILDLNGASHLRL
ncbi:SDR family oxidoreductase [Amycolatopsis sp. QT-25]|uniref:SDR family NAD(P)-dependent oxidoreductase n=1 Tax=Amycolatopsis sp. QT-25 TaxID=3034022 RepID=UPI0023EDF615|nr:SDR family NAD(P)-dependent oxidoreductase [Amycolatopsis sp. QT-25]WET81442.1 SDR family oxidoreductase [Amycolatopsis sp. QT-25]